jgi:hypothetical protein
VGDVFRRDRWLGATEIVSRSSDGTQGDKVSYDSAISSDGSRIVFRSKAKNFYPNTDAYWHVFLRDMSTGMTHAVDVNPSGQLGNQHVLEHPAVSPDGSTVVFVSQATDLLGPDWFIVHPKPHLWREGKPLEPIPLADGRPGWSINDPSMSFDGRFVAFEGGTQHYVPGDPTQGSDILLQDTLLHATQQVSSNGYDNPANFQTLRCSMSWDGRVIAFVSYADNLVPGTTGGSHVYVRISDPLTSGMVYCWPGKSTIGCQPQLALGGLPSATAGNGHDLRVEQAPNGELGLLVYSTSSSKPNLLSTDWLCVSPPLRRMPVHATGGSLPPAADCSGAFAEDFNAWIALGQDPALTAGAPVWVQGWIRDPSAAGGAIFSDAVAFIVGP